MKHGQEVTRRSNNVRLFFCFFHFYQFPRELIDLNEKVDPPRGLMSNECVTIGAARFEFNYWALAEVCALLSAILVFHIIVWNGMWGSVPKKVLWNVN